MSRILQRLNDLIKNLDKQREEDMAYIHADIAVYILDECIMSVVHNFLFLRRANERSNHRLVYEFLGTIYDCLVLQNKHGGQSKSKLPWDKKPAIHIPAEDEKDFNEQIGHWSKRLDELTHTFKVRTCFTPHYLR
jgi:hypothetical protein